MIRSFFAKLERRNVWRRSDHVAAGIGRQGVIDPRERRLWILLREIGEIVGEDETDADDQVHPFGGEQSQSCFAISALAGLDEADVRAEDFRSAIGAGVRAIVE